MASSTPPSTPLELWPLRGCHAVVRHLVALGSLDTTAQGINSSWLVTMVTAWVAFVLWGLSSFLTKSNNKADGHVLWGTVATFVLSLAAAVAFYDYSSTARRQSTAIFQLTVVFWTTTCAVAVIVWPPLMVLVVPAAVLIALGYGVAALFHMLRTWQRVFRSQVHQQENDGDNDDNNNNPPLVLTDSQQRLAATLFWHRIDTWLIKTLRALGMLIVLGYVWFLFATMEEIVYLYTWWDALEAFLIAFFCLTLSIGSILYLLFLTLLAHDHDRPSSAIAGLTLSQLWVVVFLGLGPRRPVTRASRPVRLLSRQFVVNPDDPLAEPLLMV